MTFRLIPRSVALLVALSARPVTAHHSFAAEFDATKPVTLKGTLSKAEWANPHSRMYIDVKGPDGKVVTWAILTAAPTQLMRKGWRKSQLPVGTAVIVEGYRARDGSPTASGSKVSLGDGRPLFEGSEGERPATATGRY